MTVHGSALRTGGAAVAALLCALSCAASAQSFEQPPTFDTISDVSPAGSNYVIEVPVRSDGMLRAYVLKTSYGEFAVRGDEMLRMRVNELAALAALEQVSGSSAFGDALARAGLNPLEYTGKLLTDPIETVKSTFAGIGGMFGRIGAGLANQGKTPDRPLESLLGVTDERRTLAARYGVDPYTDFPPLDAKLTQLARAAAAGGLVVSGALMAVPGAAGIVVSNLSTANKLNDVALDELARSYTAAQIMSLNRKHLIAMGASPELQDRLLANQNFTPIDMAAMVAALDSMKGVGGRDVFLERAAAAQPRYVAYFVRRQAELFAADYRRGRGFVRFASLDGNPVLIDRNGGFVVIAPVDALSWTPETAASMNAMIAAGRRAAPKRPGLLRITGQATALAGRELKRQGWTVWENQFR